VGKNESDRMRGVAAAVAYIQGEVMSVSVSPKRSRKHKVFQYENIMSQGLRTIGNKICPTATVTRGRNKPHEDGGICQASGMRSVERIAIPASEAKEKRKASQYRLMILGPSSQKLDRSTSFFVAPQVML